MTLSCSNSPASHPWHCGEAVFPVIAAALVPACAWPTGPMPAVLALSIRQDQDWAFRQVARQALVSWTDRPKLPRRRWAHQQSTRLRSFAKASVPSTFGGLVFTFERDAGRLQDAARQSDHRDTFRMIGVGGPLHHHRVAHAPARRRSYW